MFRTERTENWKIVNVAFSLCHVYIKERQMYNTADGKTGQYGNCRSLKSTF